MKSLVESLFDKDLAEKDLPEEETYKNFRKEFEKRLKQKGKVFVSGPDEYAVLYNDKDCIIYLAPDRYLSTIYVLSPETIRIGEEYLEKYGSCVFATRSKFLQSTYNYTFEYTKFHKHWSIPGIVIPKADNKLDCPVGISKKAKEIIDNYINS